MSQQSAPDASDSTSANAPGSLALWPRVLVLALVILTVAALAFRFHDELSLDALAMRETHLRAWTEAHPAGAPAIAFVIYVVVTGLSLPGATAMSVLYGWLFGFWKALVLVSFASTTGATIAFLLSRYLFGQAIQARYGERVAAFNSAIERDGAFYLFTLRLIPQIPFFVINVVMGLTKLRTTTFWWVSQLGMLPGTIVFVLAGSSVKSLREIEARGLSSLLDWKLIAALILLGVLPLAIRWLLALAQPTGVAGAATSEANLPRGE
jgi:uncharacterized membrane protein YdjX (TVP38/TMEM64 family)